jgi:hypothetical protein
MLDGALEKGRQNAPRMKEEMQVARERGKDEAHRAQKRFNDETTAVGGIPNAQSHN